MQTSVHCADLKKIYILGRVFPCCPEFQGLKCVSGVSVYMRGYVCMWETQRELEREREKWESVCVCVYSFGCQTLHFTAQYLLSSSISLCTKKKTFTEFKWQQEVPGREKKKKKALHCLCSHIQWCVCIGYHVSHHCLSCLYYSSTQLNLSG